MASSKTPSPAPVLDVRDFSVTLSDDVEQLTQRTFGAAAAASIKRAMALPPQHTTLRVNTLRLTREALLEKLAAELEGFNARLRASGREAVVPLHAGDDPIAIARSFLRARHEVDAAILTTAAAERALAHAPVDAVAELEAAR